MSNAGVKKGQNRLKSCPDHFMISCRTRDFNMQLFPGKMSNTSIETTQDIKIQFVA